MKQKEEWKVLGLMSGTSLDGLDIAYCSFQRFDNKWRGKIEVSETIAYSEYWRTQLSKTWNKDDPELGSLDGKYGEYLADKTASFIKAYKIEPELIASHGHTIFPSTRKQLYSSNRKWKIHCQPH